MVDGIPLTEHEKSLVRLERERLEQARRKKEKQNNCPHPKNMVTDLGSNRHDDWYRCRECGKEWCV